MKPNPIDFVITWGSNDDPEWKKQYEYYSAKAGRNIDNCVCRYRSWDMLHFLFRGIEKFAPWVNKVYFITNAKPPHWMNTKHPKLVVLNDKDIVPSQYMPTFSCYPIEFNFHRIKGLADKFVYFCDDMFILDNVYPTHFFRKGLPCDIGRMSANSHLLPNVYDNSCFMANALLNQHFDKRKTVLKHFFKWFPLGYPRVALANLRYVKLPKFPGFTLNHLPQIYLKKTYHEIWKYCEEELSETCSSKFRSYGDICPTLIRYWQLASGNFTPCNINKYGKTFLLNDDNISESVNCIVYQKKKLICLNDGEHVTHFEDYKEKLHKAFEMIFPDKSNFEK